MSEKLFATRQSVPPHLYYMQFGQHTHPMGSWRDFNCCNATKIQIDMSISCNAWLLFFCGYMSEIARTQKLGVSRWRATSCATICPESCLGGYQGPGMTEGQDRVRAQLDAKMLELCNQ